MNDDEWWWRLFFGYWKCGSGDIRVSTTVSKENLQMYAYTKRWNMWWNVEEEGTKLKGGNTQTHTYIHMIKIHYRDAEQKDECVYCTVHTAVVYEQF